MAGQIIEIEGREGLFVIVDEKNFEDLGSIQYERDYKIIPYDPDVDDFKVDLSKTETLKVRQVKLPFKIREDKLGYTQYGYSKIRGVEEKYFERKFEEIIIPGR